MMATLFIGEFSFLFSLKEGGAGVGRNSVNIEFGLEFVLSICRRVPLYLGLSFRGLIMRALLWGGGDIPFSRNRSILLENHRVLLAFRIQSGFKAIFDEGVDRPIGGMRDTSCRPCFA